MRISVKYCNSEVKNTKKATKKKNTTWADFPQHSDHIWGVTQLIQGLKWNAIYIATIKVLEFEGKWRLHNMKKAIWQIILSMKKDPNKQ